MESLYLKFVCCVWCLCKICELVFRIFHVVISDKVRGLRFSRIGAGNFEYLYGFVIECD